MRRLALPLLLLHLVIGAGFLAVNLGKLPHYGDTRADRDTPIVAPGYVKLAREGAGDSRRGLLYAPFLRVLHDLGGGDFEGGLGVELARTLPDASIDCHAPAWITRVQLAQLALFAAALLLAARALLRPDALGGGARALLLASVFLDPILLHAQLSLLPDGLTLSACLGFLAGAVGWLRTGRRGALLLALASGALAAGLRPEKGAVLLGAALLVAAELARRGRTRAPRARARALGLAAGCAALMLGVGAAGRALHDDADDNWSLGELVLHARVVFPHAVELQPELPDALRERFTPRLAEHYDTGLVEARQAVAFATGDDTAARAELTRELARRALTAHAPGLALDVVGDTLRNLAPTPCFLWQWTRWWLDGAQVDRTYTRGNEALWLWAMLAYHEPHWGLAAMLASAACLLLGLVVLITRRLRRATSLGAGLHEFAGVSCLALALVNALAFAASQDLFELRYVLLAHLFLVALALRALLAPTSARATPDPARDD